MSMNFSRRNGAVLKPHYDFTRFPFMRPQGETMPVSEDYVSIPPALVIRDSERALWTLGFDQGGWRTGEYEFDVVRNGRKTGERACRIEFRRGKVRIYGQDRWRTWSGNTFI
jgi:hypothetical protein